MVKDKPNSTRVFDKDGFRRRAACLCVRSVDETEVLLVSSSGRPDSWVVPGGGIEPGEEPETTAAREVLEEAGVTGNLGRCLGVFQNNEHMHRTDVFVMNVTEELDEWEDSLNIGRKRQWFSIGEAMSKLALHKPSQQAYLWCLLGPKANYECDVGDETNGERVERNNMSSVVLPAAAANAAGTAAAAANATPAKASPTTA